MYRCRIGQGRRVFMRARICLEVYDFTEKEKRYIYIGVYNGWLIKYVHVVCLSY